jgi:hypothetical protein
MIEGAAILLLGIVVGIAGDQLLARLPLRGRQQELEAKAPTCPCGHAVSFHDPESHKCHGKVHEKDPPYGYWHWNPCTCRRYTGPEPYPEFYAPEIPP